MRFPMFGGLWPIRPRDALREPVAGLTLASMNIPQILGYTRIAGTPVVTGLYTVLLPLVAFAAFGSSRHLVVAADSATAAIFASSLPRMAEPASAHYMALVGMVALLTAGLLVLARILKLGFLADFLSRTALIGFLTGVGVQVGTAMLGDMVGVAVASRRTLVQFWQVFEGLPSLNPNRLGLSLFVVASILLGKKFASKFPVSLIVVVGAIAASNRLHLSEHGFSVIGPVQGGLPSLRLPQSRGAKARHSASRTLVLRASPAGLGQGRGSRSNVEPCGRRISCSTNPSARMAPSRAATSPTTRKPTSIFAPAGTS